MAKSAKERDREARPLAGRRIVVTRAPEQAEDLAGRLQQLGAEVIFLPLVRFFDPEDTGALDQTVRSLGEFDWIVFTSANAARFFLKRCRQLNGWPSGEKPRIAAVGPATHAAVEAENLRASVVPQESNGRGLATVLAPEVGGKKVLLPRSDIAANELPSALRAAGAVVSEVVAYRTAEPEQLDSAIREALLGGEVDAVTFFSPSAFHHLAGALEDRELRALAARAAFAAVGPVTAAAIRQAGFPVAVEAPQATSASVAEALERHFAARAVLEEGA